MDEGNDVIMKNECDEAHNMRLAKRDLDAENEIKGFRTYAVSVNPINWDQFRHIIQPKTSSQNEKKGVKKIEFLGPYKAAVNAVEDGKSVVISSPPSTGKTMFAMWAATNACKHQKNFAYVVPSVEKCHEVYVELNNVDYMEHQKNWIIPNLGQNSGNLDDERKVGRNVITIEKLHELLMDRNLSKYDENKYTVFIFDDLDSMQHSGLGHLYEEAIANIECGSQIIVTLSEFSNVELVARWIATAQEGFCWVVESSFRPYFLNLNIAVQAKKMDKVGLHKVMKLEKITSSGYVWYETELQKANKQITHLQTENTLQTSRQITNSVRLAVRELFLTSSHPKSLLIVTFSQRDCQLIARDLGQNYTAITKEERQRIWFLLNKIYGIIKSRYSDTYEQMDLVREDPDFQLFEQNKNQFMHGVICIYPGMPKILRDFYDDLYRRGVIRLIVVTDEIAVNSPYRGQYILLSSIRKYDGKNYRYLTNYEFRRCLCFELRGLPPDPEKQLRSVTLILDWTISVEAFKDIVIPKPSELMSAYVPTLMTVKQRKTNNMLTSLLKKTFYNIYRMDKIETIQKDKPLLEHEIEAAANEPDIEIVKRYFALKLELEEKEKSLDAARYKYSLIKNHIKNVGRLVRIVNGDRDFGWGAILRYVAPNENVKDPLLYVALRVTRDCVDKLSDFNLVAPPHPDEEACNIDNGDGRTKTSVGICLVPVSCVIAVSDLRVKLPRVIRDPDSQRILQITINGINASTSRISKLKVSGNEEIDVMQREIRELETALRNLELTNDKIERYKDYQSKLNKMAEWNKILRSCVQTLFADEIKVLRSQIEL